MTLSAVSEAGRPHIGERRWGPIIEAVDPSGKDFGVIDPSTGAEFARVAAGGAAMVDRAVKSAHRAFDDWRKRSPHERAALLRGQFDPRCHPPYGHQQDHGDKAVGRLR